MSQIISAENGRNEKLVRPFRIRKRSRRIIFYIRTAFVAISRDFGSFGNIGTRNAAVTEVETNRDYWWGCARMRARRTRQRFVLLSIVINTVINDESDLVQEDEGNRDADFYTE